MSLNSMQSSGPIRDVRKWSWLWQPGLGMILLALVSVIAYQQVYSTYAPYDDEGYVMLSLRSHLRGAPLYDEVYSQYGPAYYVVQGTIHYLLDLPVNHDLTRLKTIVIWLGLAILASFYVKRVTHSTGAAWLALSVSFLHLDKLCLEPGHPQELMSLWVMLTLWCGSDSAHPMAWRRTLAALGVGVGVGLAVLTKLNVGLFLGLGVVHVMLWNSPSGRVRHWALMWCDAAIIALPLYLYRHHWFDPGSMALPVVIVCSVFALRWVETRSRPRQNDIATDMVVAASWRPLLVGGCAAAWVVFTVVALTLNQGTTWSGLIYGVVGQHLQFGTRFYHSPDLNPWCMGWGIAVMAVVYRATQRRDSVEGELAPWIGNSLAAATVVVLCGTIVAQVWDCTIPLQHGLQPRANTRVLMGLSPVILTALLLLDRRPMYGTGTHWMDAHRTNARVASYTLPPTVTPLNWLAWIGLLQPLAVFPTPGTQSVVGTWPLLLGCVIVSHRWWQAECHTAAFFRRQLGRILSCKVRRDSLGVGLGAGLAVATAACLPLGIRAITTTAHREQCVALDFPGCRRLRVKPEVAQPLRSLVHELRETTDTFVFAEHGHNSVYFWAEREAPTDLNATFWRFLLRPDQQQKIVDEMERLAFDGAARVGVVHEDLGVPLPAGPLASYLADHFVPVWSNGTYSVALREGTRPVGLRGQPEVQGNANAAQGEDGT